MINKVKDFFTKKEHVEYYLVEVMPRALYERRSVGGMLITMKFVKTIKRFGRSKTLVRVETFNNYHDRHGTFKYNPPYVPFGDERNDDRLRHSILVWNDCENYTFAPVTTKFLQDIIDDWFEKLPLEWYEKNNLEPLPRDDGWKNRKQ